MAHNPGMDIDLGWINGVGSINLPAVKRRAESLSGRRTVKVYQIQAALVIRGLFICEFAYSHLKNDLK